MLRDQCNYSLSVVFRIYGFYDECKRRYSIKLWKTFTDCFNCLPLGTYTILPPPPSISLSLSYSHTYAFGVILLIICLNLAALVEDRILCMHGGLSPDLKDLDQVMLLYRQCYRFISINFLDPKDWAPPWCSWSRSGMWSPVVWPRWSKWSISAFCKHFLCDPLLNFFVSGHLRMGWEWQRSVVHIWAGHCPGVCGVVWHQPHLSGTPSGGGWVPVLSKEAGEYNNIRFYWGLEPLILYN